MIFLFMKFSLVACLVYLDTGEGTRGTFAPERELSARRASLGFEGWLGAKHGHAFWPGPST